MKKRKQRGDTMQDVEKTVETAAETEAIDPAQEAAEPEIVEEAAPEMVSAETLAAAVAKQEEYLNMAQRVQADFENFRRRNQNVRKEAYDEGARAFATTLLPVIDNLERAAMYDDGEKVKEGLMMTAKSVSAVLEKLGIETVGTVGETFDPNLHNAVFHVEDESFSEGEIVEVFQKGYKKGNKIIRFAMVKTAN